MFLLPFFSRKISERQLLIHGGILIGGFYFLYLLIGMVPIVEGKYTCYFILALLFGILNSLVGVAVQVVFVSRTPEALVGRIGAIFNSLACSAMPMGSFALAGLSMVLSVKKMYMLMGVLSIVIFMLLGQWKGVAELEE